MTVVYAVGDAAAGATEALRLTATSQGDASKTASADVSVRVVRAAIALSKAAYRDNKLLPVGPGDEVQPGEYLQYRIAVTNSGLAAATTVHVADPLPAAVAYDATTADAAGWTIVHNAGTVTADLAGTLATGQSRHFWIRVRVR